MKNRDLMKKVRGGAKKLRFGTDPEHTHRAKRSEGASPVEGGAGDANGVDGVSKRLSEVFSSSLRKRGGAGKDPSEQSSSTEYPDELEPNDARHRDIARTAALTAKTHTSQSEAVEADEDEFSEFFDGQLPERTERIVFSPRSGAPVPPGDVRLRTGIHRGDTIFDDPDRVLASERRRLEGEALDEETKKERFDRRMRIFWRVWTFVRVPFIIAATVLLVFLLVNKVGRKLYKDYFMPVDPNDATPIVVTIPTGSGASEIAKILYEACGEGETGLIAHKAVFKVYVDFIGKSSRLQAGTYVLSKNMSIPDLVNAICRGVPPREIVKLQIPEGLTLEAMAAKLVTDGIIKSPDRFLELCKTGEAFKKDHPFIETIPEDATGERQYALEGFLFPDTYDIYAGASEETIIDKMLSRFEQIFGAVYSARASELGLSVYEVVTLASTIEKEAKVKDDFARVGAVFYNRIDRSMPLASDATIEYVLKTGSIRLTEAQLATLSGYNTHINRGLPLGPISNPGDAALNAALYPNEEYRADAYMFFCLMDPETGALAFAKTLEEHNRNVEKYSPLW